MSDVMSSHLQSTQAAVEAEPVWKMIYLARRNPELAAADFPQAWREHSALGRQCRNVAQRVQAVAQCSRVLEAQASAFTQAYDGVNLMVLADRESGLAIWSDPDTLAVMRPDEPRVFADYVRNFSMLCREQVLFSEVPEPALAKMGDTLLIGFLQLQHEWQRAAAGPEELPAAWLAGGLAHARRVVCNLVDEPPPAGYGYRCIVEWWFEDVAQALAAAEGVKSAAFGGCVFMLTQVTHSRP